jgi:GT2 family glycosyltransferase
VVPYPGAFNFAAINNAGVARARGEHVVLLNNDTEVIAGQWLEAMLEHSQRREVGAVGARLLYPDGRIQHAGVVLGLGGVAGHSHKHRPAEQPGALASVAIVRNYSAVTAACLMMRRALYLELGGMNERDLAVAFNDVDLCLRIRAAGYRVVYTPYATLYHHESASRGFDLDGSEVLWMRRTWGPALARDPYYNPNLTTVREDFSLAL